MAMDVLQWSRHYRCFPGQGGFDLAGLVAARAARRIRRARSPWRSSTTSSGRPTPGRTAVDARRSLLVLQEAAGLASLPAPRRRPPASPSPNSSPPTPNRSRPLLSALGFTRTARHRSKPVDLWEQGGARILVNTGPAARPRAAPALAAIGLESPDPAGRRPPRRGPARPGAAAPPRAARTPRSTRSPHPTAPNSSSARTGRRRTRPTGGDFDADSPRHERTEHAEHRRGRTGQLRRDPHRPSRPHPALAPFDEATLFHRSVLGLQRPGERRRRRPLRPAAQPRRHQRRRQRPHRPERRPRAPRRRAPAPSTSRWPPTT